MTVADEPRAERDGAEKDAAQERRELVRDAETRLRDMFLHARYVWATAAVDLEPLEALAEAWSRLEGRLHSEPSLEALRQEVLEGLTEPSRQPARPTETSLLTTLPAVGEAVRLMEEVFDRLRLHRSGASPHPRTLGWLNRFGRWAAAPRFVAWWPWLVPLHSRPFTDYMQRTFALPPGPARPGTVRPFAEGDSQYALRHWRAWRRTMPPRGSLPEGAEHLETFGLFVDLGEPWPSVNTAVVDVHRLAGEPAKAYWKADDLFVPPGLWGTGLGDRLLHGLESWLREHHVGRMVVDMTNQSSADRQSLYTGHGFHRRSTADELFFEKPLDRR